MLILTPPNQQNLIVNGNELKIRKFFIVTLLLNKIIYYRRYFCPNAKIVTVGFSHVHVYISGTR